MGWRHRVLTGFAAVASGVAIATAAPAAADPTQDFLDILAYSPGFTVNAFTTGFLTSAGNGVCEDLRAGIPIDQAQNRAMFIPGSTPYSARTIAEAAQSTLCPETLPA